MVVKVYFSRVMWEIVAAMDNATSIPADQCVLIIELIPNTRFLVSYTEQYTIV